MRLKLFASVFLIVTITLLLLQAVQPSHAAGIIGTGTPDSCNEGALDAALAGGGAITFNCGQSKVVIEVLKEKVISQPTTIDGLGLVTIGLPCLIWGWSLFLSSTWHMTRAGNANNSAQVQAVKQPGGAPRFSRPPWSSRPSRSRPAWPGRK